VIGRHGRQARLAGVGAEGQAGIEQASVDVGLEGFGAEVAARYLAGAGVKRVRVRTEAAAQGARAIDGAVQVEVECGLDGAAPEALDLRDPSALELARGALLALRALRHAATPVTASAMLPGTMHDAKEHPWVLGELVAPRRLLDEVDGEARRAYERDEESCGLLVGPASDGRRLDGIVPMVNRANALHRLDPEQYPRTGRTYFDVDSMKFEAAIRRGQAEGRPVKVLYHSHLDASAYFSPTDAEVAKMGQGEPPWALAYLVTSIRSGQVDDRKLFVWDPIGRGFVESRLEVEEA
jgi:proteasome lid subunit RPN8/RPN11